MVNLAKKTLRVSKIKDGTVIDHITDGHALDVIKITRLLEKKDFLPGELPYADRKLLELSRAVATDPSVLLLDEIASGLNPAETKEIVTLIGKMKDMGITMIVVEHVMDFIMSISDRIIVLNYGKKIANQENKHQNHDKHYPKGTFCYWLAFR